MRVDYCHFPEHFFEYIYLCVGLSVVFCRHGNEVSDLSGYIQTSVNKAFSLCPVDTPYNNTYHIIGYFCCLKNLCDDSGLIKMCSIHVCFGRVCLCSYKEVLIIIFHSVFDSGNGLFPCHIEMQYRAGENNETPERKHGNCEQLFLFHFFIFRFFIIHIHSPIPLLIYYNTHLNENKQ